MTLPRFAVVSIVCAWLFACDREPPPRAAPSAPAVPAAAVPAAAKPAPQQAPAPTGSTAIVMASLGQTAPDFTLTDIDGKTHTLSQLRGKTVVLEWFNPDCPFVRFAHTQGPLKDMAARVARPDRVWLSINSSAPGKQGHGAERNRQARAEYAIANPILLDESGQVGHVYGAIKTPHLFIVDAQGKLVFRGGVDNAPMGEVDPARPRPEAAKAGETVNYVDAALEDLQQHGPPRLADVPPYGCSVKYAS